MVFLAGLDEAGYGPFVGPLTVGFSLFRLPSLEQDLWDDLSSVACKKPGRGDTQHLWLNDSKSVHSGPKGRDRLERTVAAFRELTQPGNSSLDDWVTAQPAGPPRWFHAAPWFRHLKGRLTEKVTEERSRLDAALLSRALQQVGAQCVGFGARAVPACEWNQLTSAQGGKAGANFYVSMSIVRHLLEVTGDAPLRIELDRHGARTRYGSMLQSALSPDSIKVHGEGAGGSAYTLHIGSRSVEVRFSQGADLEHLPVSLASLAAKQTRERLMDIWNEWFQARLDGIAPTKGYGVDGKRWIHEAGPRLAELQLDAGLVMRRL